MFDWGIQFEVISAFGVFGNSKQTCGMTIKGWTTMVTTGEPPWLKKPQIGQGRPYVPSPSPGTRRHFRHHWAGLRELWAALRVSRPRFWSWLGHPLVHGRSMGVKINSGAIPNSLKASACIQSYTYKHAMVLHNGKGTRATNLNRYLHRNPPEADQVSAPEPSRTATGICSGTLRNLTRYLHWNPLELYQVSQLT